MTVIQANSAPPPRASPQSRQWPARFGHELYRFALNRVANADTATELVQETLLSALEAIATFRGEASERTLLFVILRRKIIDHYRRQARSPLVPLAGPPDQAPADGRGPNAETAGPWAMGGTEGRGDLLLEQQEFRQVLQGCQDCLPPQYRAVFVLRFLEELPTEVICQELCLSPSNYWVIVHRARRQLRLCLEKNWFRTPATN